MNHDAINRLIHEIAYPGACLDHDMIYDADLDGSHCVKCKLYYKAIFPLPSYTTDANAAIDLLDKKLDSFVLRKLGENDFTFSAGYSPVSQRTPCLAVCAGIALMAGRLEEFQKLMEEK